MEMIRKDCHYLQCACVCVGGWEYRINPFGIVQVGCGLTALGFPSQDGKAGGLSPGALLWGPLFQDLEKRLVGLM